MKLKLVQSPEKGTWRIFKFYSRRWFGESWEYVTTIYGTEETATSYCEHLVNPKVIYFTSSIEE